MKYLKKSIWKFELVLLILSFFVAACTSNVFPGIETEIKDAVAAVTLGMLYCDKRKEWKNNEKTKFLKEHIK